jgi:cobalamin-dependent methionine synthase I
MIDSSKWDIIEAGLGCARKRFDFIKEGEEQFIHHAKLIKLRCCSNYHGF